MENKKSISKLGVLCLILAVAIISMTDMRILLTLGFLYYAYKLLHKKEPSTNLDRVLILVLVALLALEIFLTLYLSAS
jgi:hypothetical protein